MTASARRRAVTREADPVAPPASVPIPPDHALVPVRPSVQLPAGFRVGQDARRAPPPAQTFATPAERLSAQKVQMDAGTHRKLTRGKLRPEARIDLHGMTQDQAHNALSRFLRNAQADGMKFVIVVTGKGLRGASGSERGVLRREVEAEPRQ